MRYSVVDLYLANFVDLYLANLLIYLSLYFLVKIIIFSGKLKFDFFKRGVYI